MSRTLRIHPVAGVGNLLARFVILLALFGLFVQPATAAGAPALLAGEECHYGIDFLIFKNLAAGNLRFSAESTPGRYRAELEARTLGVAAWLTGERTQRYVAVMEETGTGRLRSVSYESTVLKRKGDDWSNRGKRFRFDYRAGKVYYERSNGGGYVPTKEYSLPADQNPVDMLTGFYNLRLGIYGKLIPGARLQIPTLTSKGFAAIDVEVLPASARQSLPFFPERGTLLRVRVDPEVFDTGNAVLYAFLDETGRPSCGIVEDIIGMGDVFGYLLPRETQPGVIKGE